MQPKKKAEIYAWRKFQNRYYEKNQYMSLKSFSTKICLSFDSCFPQLLKILCTKKLLLYNCFISARIVCSAWIHNTVVVNPYNNRLLLQNVLCSPRFTFNTFSLPRHLWIHCKYTVDQVRPMKCCPVPNISLFWGRVFH